MLLKLVYCKIMCALLCSAVRVLPTVVPVPEVICVTDGVDGEVVDDTTGGHVGVSLRVNVGVTFPRLPGPELCRHR